MRSTRLRAPGAAFHVTAHGVDERPIFLDEVDRQTFVNRVGHIKRRLGWAVYALCLMTTHYHLVVLLSDDNLRDGMRVINGAHARLFNKRHTRRGPVFEARYDARLVKDGEHLGATIRYVALNPVAAGMVEQPQDWVWSTYAQLIGAQPAWSCFDREATLQLFGSVDDVRQAIEGTRHYRNDAHGSSPDTSTRP